MMHKMSVAYFVLTVRHDPDWHGQCRRFSFSFATGPESVGMATGATIHTAHGHKVKVAHRQPSQLASEASQANLAAV